MVIEKMEWLEPQPVGRPEETSGQLQRATYYRKTDLQRKFFVKDLTQKKGRPRERPFKNNANALGCA